MYLGYQKERIVCVGYSEQQVKDTKGVEVDRVTYTPLVYVLYNGDFVTEEEAETRSKQDKAKARIKELKELLASTDYVVLKVAEGVSSFADYEEIFEKRQLYRNQINELEKQS